MIDTLVVPQALKMQVCSSRSVYLGIYMALIITMLMTLEEIHAILADDPRLIIYLADIKPRLLMLQPKEDMFQNPT